METWVGNQNTVGYRGSRRCNMGRVRVPPYSPNKVRSSDALLVEGETGTIFLDGNLAADNKNFDYINVF